MNEKELSLKLETILDNQLIIFRKLLSLEQKASNVRSTEHSFVTAFKELERERDRLHTSKNRST